MIECPECRKPMQEGISTIRSTVFGFIFRGLSYQCLFFKSKDKTFFDQKVMSPYNRKNSFYCESCDILLLKNNIPKKDTPLFVWLIVLLILLYIFYMTNTYNHLLSIKWEEFRL